MSDSRAVRRLFVGHFNDDPGAPLRAELKGQLNAGIDPEVLVLGTELAAFHIEADAQS